MKRRSKNKLKALVSILFIVFLFILVSYIVQRNVDNIKPVVQGYGVIGILVYVGLLILEAVFAPISVAPIIPIMSNTYGFFAAFIFTFIGWFCGACISFWIARHFGKPLLRRLASLETLERLERLLPEKHKFLGLVALRIFIPLDILDYFLGMFTKIKIRTFVTATFFGMIPATIFLVYVGSLNATFQAIGAVVLIAIVALIWISAKIIGYKRIRSLLDRWGIGRKINNATS